MRKHRRGAAGAVLVALAVVACTSESDESTPTDGPAATEAPAPTEAPGDDAGDGETAAEPPVTEAPASDPPEGEAPATEPPATDTPATDTPATEPAATEPPVTESPGPPEPEIGGRALATEVQSESQFDGNPFPDLVVDDIGRAGQANIANILPSDRPVLLWTWAPH